MRASERERAGERERDSESGIARGGEWKRERESKG